MNEPSRRILEVVASLSLAMATFSLLVHSSFSRMTGVDSPRHQDDWTHSSMEKGLPVESRVESDRSTAGIGSE